MDLNEKFGKLPLSEVLEPAIHLAEKGFPVAGITSVFWMQDEAGLKSAPNGEEMLIDGKAPKEGQVFVNKNLASTLRAVAEQGKKGFYEGMSIFWLSVI